MKIKHLLFISAGVAVGVGVVLWRLAKSAGPPLDLPPQPWDHEAQRWVDKQPADDEGKENDRGEYIEEYRGRAMRIYGVKDGRVRTSPF